MTTATKTRKTAANQDTIYNLIMATGNFKAAEGKAMAKKVREIGAKTERDATEQAIASWFYSLVTQDTIYNLIMATGNFKPAEGEAMAEKVREIGAKTERDAVEQGIASWFYGLMVAKKAA